MDLQQEDKNFIFLVTRYVRTKYYAHSPQEEFYVSAFEQLADGTKVAISVKNNSKFQFVFVRDAGMCRTTMEVVATLQQCEISDEELNA